MVAAPVATPGQHRWRGTSSPHFRPAKLARSKRGARRTLPSLTLRASVDTVSSVCGAGEECGLDIRPPTERPQCQLTSLTESAAASNRSASAKTGESGSILPASARTDLGSSASADEPVGVVDTRRRPRRRAREPALRPACRYPTLRRSTSHAGRRGSWVFLYRRSSEPHWSRFVVTANDRPSQTVQDRPNSTFHPPGGLKAIATAL